MPLYNCMEYDNARHSMLATAFVITVTVTALVISVPIRLEPRYAFRGDHLFHVPSWRPSPSIGHSLKCCFKHSEPLGLY